MKEILPSTRAVALLTRVQRETSPVDSLPCKSAVTQMLARETICVRYDGTAAARLGEEIGNVSGTHIFTHMLPPQRSRKIGKGLRISVRDGGTRWETAGGTAMRPAEFENIFQSLGEKNYNSRLIPRVLHPTPASAYRDACRGGLDATSAALVGPLPDHESNYTTLEQRGLRPQLDEGAQLELRRFCVGPLRRPPSLLAVSAIESQRSYSEGEESLYLGQAPLLPPLPAVPGGGGPLTSSFQALDLNCPPAPARNMTQGMLHGMWLGTSSSAVGFGGPLSIPVSVEEDLINGVPSFIPLDPRRSPHEIPQTARTQRVWLEEDGGISQTPAELPAAQIPDLEVVMSGLGQFVLDCQTPRAYFVRQLHFWLSPDVEESELADLRGLNLGPSAGRLPITNPVSGRKFDLQGNWGGVVARWETPNHALATIKETCLRVMKGSVEPSRAYLWRPADCFFSVAGVTNGQQHHARVRKGEIYVLAVHNLNVALILSPVTTASKTTASKTTALRFESSNFFDPLDSRRLFALSDDGKFAIESATGQIFNVRLATLAEEQHSLEEMATPMSNGVIADHVRRVQGLNQQIDEDIRAEGRFVLNPETYLCVERESGRAYIANCVEPRAGSSISELFDAEDFEKAREFALGRQGSRRVVVPSAVQARKLVRSLTVMSDQANENEDANFLYLVHPPPVAEHEAQLDHLLRVAA